MHREAKKKWKIDEKRDKRVKGKGTKGGGDLIRMENLLFS